MGKLTNNPEEGTTMTKPSSQSLSSTVVNSIFYLLCATVLSLSVYTSYRQIHLEDRVHHIQHLDERITVLEATLRTLQLSPPLYDRPPADTNDSASDDITNVVRKLSLSVAGIQRLRRDVSSLQVSRRERQASIQQPPPDCICPAGTCGFVVTANYV